MQSTRIPATDRLWLTRPPKVWAGKPTQRAVCQCSFSPFAICRFPLGLLTAGVRCSQTEWV